MGDQLLKNVALRLGNAVRQSDTVARLGGDEFIILLPGAQDTKNIEKIARTIIQTLNQPFIIDEQTITVGVSIGISVFPDNALEAVTMIKQADKAMYEAKNGGKNNYKFSEESES
jgi:diguanylate cyclase (GGDEF)-like protein